MKRGVTSYDTIMSLSLNEVLRISSANLNVSVKPLSINEHTITDTFKFAEKVRNTYFLFLILTSSS